MSDYAFVPLCIRFIKYNAVWATVQIIGNKILKVAFTPNFVYVKIKN